MSSFVDQFLCKVGCFILGCRGTFIAACTAKDKAMKCLKESKLHNSVINEFCFANYTFCGVVVFICKHLETSSDNINQM